MLTQQYKISTVKRSTSYALNTTLYDSIRLLLVLDSIIPKKKKKKSEYGLLSISSKDLRPSM